MSPSDLLESCRRVAGSGAEDPDQRARIRGNGWSGTCRRSPVGHTATAAGRTPSRTRPPASPSVRRLPTTRTPASTTWTPSIGRWRSIRTAASGASLPRARGSGAHARVRTGLQRLLTDWASPAPGASFRSPRCPSGRRGVGESRALRREGHKESSSPGLKPRDGSDHGIRSGRRLGPRHAVSFHIGAGNHG